MNSEEREARFEIAKLKTELADGKRQRQADLLEELKERCPEGYSIVKKDDVEAMIRTLKDTATMLRSVLKESDHGPWAQRVHDAIKQWEAGQ